MFRRLFGWWRDREKRLHPERVWRVSISDDLLEVVDHDGKRLCARLEDIHAIVADMAGDHLQTDWWLLDAREGCILAFPWGSQGEAEAVKFFQSLAGFDWDKFTAAVRATTDSSFVVWKRPDKRSRED